MSREVYEASEEKERLTWEEWSTTQAQRFEREHAKWRDLVETFIRNRELIEKGFVALERFAQNPSPGSAISEAGGYLTYLLLTLFGGGGAAVVARNKISNAKKARVEMELRGDIERSREKIEELERLLATRVAVKENS